MMSKNANNHGNLTFSKTPVSLNDIAKTVCTATINNSQCDIYDGYDLFSDKKPSRNQYRPLAINKMLNTKEALSSGSISYPPVISLMMRF